MRQPSARSALSRRQRSIGAALGGLLLLAAAPAQMGTAGPARASTQQSVQVVVQTVGGASASAAAAVRRLGGHVVRELPIIDGFSATLPAGLMPTLRNTPGIRAVTPDAKGHLLSIDPTLGYDPVSDSGSLNNITRVVQAQDSWKAGYTGQGIDIAMIDSGVSPVQGLTSGNVVNGPDLSFDSQNPALTNLDGYGHGTHMASIIVGRDQAGTAATYSSPSTFAGIAPDARLISVKVAAADGATDVSQVIAALGWVDQHAHDPGFNIRVVNLSFGTDSTQAYSADPLAYAAEVAWRHGLVVVVAAGNDGSATHTLASPALDPFVLAVGAEDSHGTVSASDDTIPTFSQRGSASRPVDVVAPGVHVLGLRDPNGFLDQKYPTGEVGSRFFRGSGTPHAAAVVSGAAALLIQRYPTLSSNQIKLLLEKTALSFKVGSDVYRGHGLINVRAAQLMAPIADNVDAVPGSGTGSLELARGSSHVSAGGVALTGEQDIFGHAFTSSAWAPSALAGNSWSGGVWNGNTWSGNSWSGNSWSGTTWSGVTWTGNTWSGNTWSGNTWSGNTWSGNSWSGNSWSGNSWSGNTWSGNTWSGASWG
ncbi:MAG: hypothetical protein NVSMB13_10870 [Mycobacteriales bacterium]